jgi:predicted CXXCH cytochrome family protein
MVDTDRAVFSSQAKGMCRHCHHMQQVDGKWHVPLHNPTLVTTAENNEQSKNMVPERWLHHGNFHHQSHRAIACTECHEAAKSTSTSDILLPSIATCRKCHGSEAETPTTIVRDNCTMCHTYHMENHSFTGVSLEQIFTGNPQSRNPSPP